MLFKEHWPSAQKLSNLRSQGILPYSPVASSLLVTLLLLLTLVIRSDELLRIASFSTWLSITGRQDLLLQLEEVLNLIMALTLVAAFGYLAAGLLQNMFYFRLSAIGFQASRFGFRRVAGFFNCLFGDLLRVMLVGLLGVLIFYLAATQFSHLLGSAPTQVARLKLSSAVLTLVIALLSLLIIGASVLAHLLFRLRHRMTQAELVQERRAGTG